MMDWPWGKRAVVDEHGVVETLDDDAPVQWWVCCRVDEPWTWTVMSHQFTGACARCGGTIIYRLSANAPTNASVQKICRRCAERLIEADGEGGAAVRADG